MLRKAPSAIADDALRERLGHRRRRINLIRFREFPCIGFLCDALSAMNSRAALLLLLSAVVAPSLAQPPAVEPEAVFVNAEPIEKTAPRYPSAAAARGREGWVVLSYVVSKEGEVTDVMIEDSSGGEDFERAAKRNMRRWQYQPAMRNGEPVAQSMVRSRIVFSLGNSPNGAGRTFIQRFGQIQQLIDEGNLDEAEGMLTDLQYRERRNLYEDAWFWWLRFVYLHATGEAESHELISTLRRAVGYEEDYLPPELFVAAALRLYALQAQALDFSGALTTFERLQQSETAKRAEGYPEALAELERSSTQIGELINGDQLLRMDARVGEHGYWVHDLLRRSFSLAKVQGELELLDLRCDRGTTQYASVSEELAWDIPESWGECGVYIKGSEGTTFEFYEYPLEG